MQNALAWSAGYSSVVQNDGAKPPEYPIGSVDTTLRLLQLFRERPSIGVAEAASRLGVARSTAHRMLAMLVYRGFAVQDPQTRSYLPGPGLVEVGLAAVRSLDVRSVARPVMERLSSEVEETVHLGMLQEREIVLLDAARPFDNGWALPRGLLREPPAHLRRAGIVVLTNAQRVDQVPM